MSKIKITGVKTGIKPEKGQKISISLLTKIDKYAIIYSISLIKAKTLKAYSK